jgi:hypothetical protein
MGPVSDDHQLLTIVLSHDALQYSTDRAQLYPLGDFSNIHFEK